MNAKPWLLPGAALLISSVWIVSGKRSAAKLEQEIDVLTQRIQMAKALGNEDSKAGGGGKDAQKAKDGKIDWKDVSRKMAEMRGAGGMGDMRTMMRLQRLLMDMSAEDLGKQYDEIAALGLDESTRKQLQSMIIGMMAEKDPKRVIERFGSEAADDMNGGGWGIRMALGKWAETDPVAAAVWLDQQVAAGKLESKSLDGKNQLRMQYEGMIMNQLLKTDPSAAAARVMALPEDQRADLFQQSFFFKLTKESEGAYAKLVRDSVPAGQVGSIISQTAGNLVQNGGYERVDGFIATAKATDEEKKVIVEQVMQNTLNMHGDTKIKAEDLDKARAWGATQSPGAVDKATGDALANSLWRGGDFKSASELALQYNAASGNDEVLATFLKSGAVQGKATDEAKALIDRIKDPAVREEIRALPQFKP